MDGSGTFCGPQTVRDINFPCGLPGGIFLGGDLFYEKIAFCTESSCGQG